MYYYDQLFGKGLTPKFSDIFPDFETFSTMYDENKLKQINDTNTLSAPALENLYYLLYARYGDRSIAYFDINQFVYALFAVVFMYGPTWERRLDLQSKIRGLTEEDIITSDSSSQTHAYNPSTLDTEEINYINEQNKTKRTRSKIEGLALASSLLEKDVSRDFLDKFASLFRRGVINICPIWYETPMGFPEDLLN